VEACTGNGGAHGSVRARGGWHTERRLHATARGVFEVTFLSPGPETYPAEVDGQTSLTWAQR
jgi:hypothetical protein